MANDTKVTLAADGSAKEERSVSQILIPDLWHIASGIRTGALVTPCADSADLILEVWNLAHDFKRHIQES